MTRQWIKDMVPVEVYKRVVDEVAHTKPAFYIWGGEPFLYKDLMELVEYIKARGAGLSIINNGTMLKRHAERIVRLGVDNLMLSLDGPPDVHDRVRGRAGTFDKLAASIREINLWKKRLKTLKPYVVILTTLTPEGVDLIVPTMEIAADLRTDFVGVYFSWYTTEKIGRAHAALMKREFNCNAIAWKGYLSDPSKFDVPRLLEEMREVRAREWPFDYMFVPRIADEDVPKYFTEPWNTFGNKVCTSPWTATEIQANGDVATCRDHPDYIVGNIKDEPLMRIFNNAAYRKFRRRLQMKGLLPICSRCCGLMGF
jgi:radical SAM protein with 4Fe4S-binding SPASM domain